MIAIHDRRRLKFVLSLVQILSYTYESVVRGAQQSLKCSNNTTSLLPPHYYCWIKDIQEQCD